MSVFGIPLTSAKVRKKASIVTIQYEYTGDILYIRYGEKYLHKTISEHIYHFENGNLQSRK